MLKEGEDAYEDIREVMGSINSEIVRKKKIPQYSEEITVWSGGDYMFLCSQLGIQVGNFSGNGHFCPWCYCKKSEFSSENPSPIRNIADLYNYAHMSAPESITGVPFTPFQCKGCPKVFNSQHVRFFKSIFW